MKLQKWILVAACLCMLMGCSTASHEKTKEEEMAEKFTEFTRKQEDPSQEFGSASWQLDFTKDGRNSFIVWMGKDCYEYEFSSITEEQTYEITGMRYTNEDIAEDQVFYHVLYPQKIEDTSEVTEENNEKVEKLKAAFENSLEKYDISWEELDEIIYYKRQATTNDTR